MRPVILISLAVALATSASGASAGLGAQEERSAGLAALELPVGARPLGMGRAFVASAGDIQGLLYNPAGLAGRDSTGFTFSRYQGSSDLDVNGNFAAASIPLLAGVATLGVNYEDLGEFTLTGSTPDPLGTRDLRNLLLVGSYAVSLPPGLAVGASVKYLRSDLGVADGTGFAVDAGARFRAPAVLPVSLGLAVLNVGPDINFELDSGEGEQSDAGDEPLPSRLRYGASLELGDWMDPAGLYGLVIAADVEHDLRELGEVSVFGGAAIDFRDVVILRGGVLRLNNAFGAEATTGASLGAGVQWRGLRIDVARELGVNEIDDETHFSLGADF